MREILCALLAISFHGLGHISAALACGVRTRKIRFSATGLRLEMGEGIFPSYNTELIIALGGPLGNLLGNALLLFLSYILRHGEGGASLLALCQDTVPLSLFLGIWNLLPIEGFDGGRMLRCLLSKRPCRMSLPTIDRILAASSAGCFLTLWVLAVYLLLRTGRAVSLFVFCVQLFWGNFMERDLS
ncbi:MAG: hypothetical protein IJW40_00385 [Clostridia bacterium]|nr:hypothetical protein [Clostridia bacterium]